MAKGNKTATGTYELAYILFMQKIPQKEIAVRIGVSEKTVSKWKSDGSWESKRAAKTISMDTLIVKALGKINDLLDSDDFSADSFAKAVAQLKTLKTSNTIDDEIMCFMAFQSWILENRQAEKIEEAFIKQLTKLQDAFIQFRLGNYVIS